MEYTYLDIRRRKDDTRKMPKPFPKALVFCNRPLIQFRVCAYNIKINVIMGKLTNSVLGNVG